jgi:ABC-type xylose transport system substrate-binding protein
MSDKFNIDSNQSNIAKEGGTINVFYNFLNNIKRKRILEPIVILIIFIILVIIISSILISNQGQPKKKINVFFSYCTSLRTRSSDSNNDLITKLSAEKSLVLKWVPSSPEEQVKIVSSVLNRESSYENMDVLLIRAGSKCDKISELIKKYNDDNDNRSINDSEKKYIQILSYDRKIDFSDFYIGYKGFEIGKLQFQGIINVINAIQRSNKNNISKKKYMVIRGPDSDPNSKALNEGYNAMSKNSSLSKIDRDYKLSDWSKSIEESRTYIEKELTDYNDQNLKAVLCPNDDSVESIMNVLIEKNRTDICVSGQDGKPSLVNNIKDNEAYKNVSTVSRPYDMLNRLIVSKTINLINKNKINYKEILGENKYEEIKNNIYLNPELITSSKLVTSK